jgi:hypothetical protein
MTKAMLRRILSLSYQRDDSSKEARREARDFSKHLPSRSLLPPGEHSRKGLTIGLYAHFGGRFSRKAATPSMQSAEERERALSSQA